MSYNRYRKRDKSEIDRKSEIGLDRVENYNTADISENVIHHVRDYLYTPNYLEVSRNITQYTHNSKNLWESYGIMKFYESGHSMFITSTCTSDNDGNREVFDTISGSVVYNKPTEESILRGDSKCPIEFKLLGNYETSKLFIHCLLIIDVVKEKDDIVTYISFGPNQKEESPIKLYGSGNGLGIRFIGTNLHDYTLRAVDYTDNSSPYINYSVENKILLKSWEFRLSDYMRLEFIAVPLWDNEQDWYYHAKEGETINLSQSNLSSATINGVPFCGVKGLEINGKSARNITVTAKHSGSDKEDAGEHEWEVLKSYPFLTYKKYTGPLRRGRGYSIIYHYTNNTLSTENDPSDKAGLCYLSDYTDTTYTIDDFLESLGYWIFDENGERKKNNTLTPSSVITVAILKKLWELLDQDIDDRIKNKITIEDVVAKINEILKPIIVKINNNSSVNSTQNKKIKTLEDTIESLKGRIEALEARPEPAEPEPTEEKIVELVLNEKNVILTYPGASDNTSFSIKPIGNIYQIYNDGSRKRLLNGNTPVYTKWLKYKWEGNGECPFDIKLGTKNIGTDFTEITGGSLDGTKEIIVSLKNPENTGSFTANSLKFETRLDNKIDTPTDDDFVLITYTKTQIIPEKTPTDKYITLDVQDYLTFSYPNGIVEQKIYPVSKVYQKYSDGSVEVLDNKYASKLKFSWGNPNIDSSPFSIEVGSTLLNRMQTKEVGPLDGTTEVTITVLEPENLDTFVNKSLGFVAEYEGIGGSDTTYVSFVNNSIISHGMLINDYKNDVYCSSNNDTYYLGIGSDKEFRYTYEDYVNNGHAIHIYLNQVLRKDGLLKNEDRYELSLKESYSTASLSTDKVGSGINEQDIWVLNDEFGEIEVGQLTRTYTLCRNSGEKFVSIKIAIEGKVPYIQINPGKLSYGDSKETKEVEVSTNYPPIDFELYDCNEWITCEYKKQRKDGNDTIFTYNITADANTKVVGRDGYIVFFSSGISDSLPLEQGAQMSYILAYPQGQTSAQGPGGIAFYTSNTPNEETYTFEVESNIDYKIYLDGVFDQQGSTTSGMKHSCSVSIPANQTTESQDHSIEIRGTNQKVIVIQVTKIGVTDEMNIAEPKDPVFHKENAFDLQRTSKTVIVSCQNPENITVNTDNNDLIANVIIRDKKLYIRCYPRTVKIWNSNKTVKLQLGYRNKTKEISFVIEKTTETVGQYFNVSSTIESFTKSDISNQTIKITSWCPFWDGGEPTAEAKPELYPTNNRSSVLSISPCVWKPYGDSHICEWTVTIPAGAAPTSKTCWTLTLKYPTAGNKTKVKYISIYESSDVSWITGQDELQFTAFGHLSMLPGCDIKPIVYLKRTMKSNIGTNLNRNSTQTTTFCVPYILHDLSNITISSSGSGGTWVLNNSNNIKYSCSQDIVTTDHSNRVQGYGTNHDGITVKYRNNETCYFGSYLSTDINCYRDIGSICDASEVIDGLIDLSSNISIYRMVVLPYEKFTLPQPFLNVYPKSYFNNTTPVSFFPCPPDWWIHVYNATGYENSQDEQMSGYSSEDGYLNVTSDIKEVNGWSTFSYEVNTGTNLVHTDHIYSHIGSNRGILHRDSTPWLDYVISGQDEEEQVLPVVTEQLLGSLNDGGNQFNIIDRQSNKLSSLDNTTGSSIGYSISKNGSGPKIPELWTLEFKMKSMLNLGRCSLNLKDREAGNRIYSYGTYRNALFYDMNQLRFSTFEKLSSTTALTPLNINTNFANLSLTSTLGYKFDHSMTVFEEDFFGLKSNVSMNSGTCTVQVGLCSIATNPTNSEADSLFVVPVVRVTCTSSDGPGSFKKDVVVYKSWVACGIGIKSNIINQSKLPIDISKFRFETTYTSRRKRISDTRYEYIQDISINTGVIPSVDTDNWMIGEINHPLYILSREDTVYNIRKSSGNLSFTLTHGDFLNIIKKVVELANNSGVSVSLADLSINNYNYTNYFKANNDESMFDSPQEFVLGPGSKLNNITLYSKFLNLNDF